MVTLFSYVVDHDYGYAPNPYDGVCTLVHCKFGGVSGRRNIIEMAEEGDWVLGSGGASRQSAGNGKIIYLMRVDEKLEFGCYLKDTRFIDREDHADGGHGNKFALVSHNYFYFGRNAISSSELPSSIPVGRLFKKGPNFRRDLPASAVRTLVAWFERSYEVGMHGYPCIATSTNIKPRKPLKICSSRRCDTSVALRSKASCSRC